MTDSFLPEFTPPLSNLISPPVLVFLLLIALPPTMATVCLHFFSPYICSLGMSPYCLHFSPPSPPSQEDISIPYWYPLITSCFQDSMSPLPPTIPLPPLKNTFSPTIPPSLFSPLTHFSFFCFHCLILVGALLQKIKNSLVVLNK